MTTFKKILLVNLGIFVFYTALFCVSYDLKDGYAFLGLAMLIAAHAAISFVASIVLFILKKKEAGQAFLLSTGLVFLIGFSACFGLGTLV